MEYLKQYYFNCKMNAGDNAYWSAKSIIINADNIYCR